MNALKHGEITEKIVDELMSGKAPEIIKIAARYHDIERDFPDKVNTKNCRPEDYLARKLLHSANSVKIFIKHFSKNYDDDLVEDVLFLIARHEIGGDRDAQGGLLYVKDYSEKYNLNELADVLFYADKLTFFEAEIEEYSKRGEEKLKNKILFSINNLPEDILNIIKNKKYSTKEIKNLVTNTIDEKIEMKK